MSREIVRCRVCGRVHLQVPRDEVPEYERELLERCCMCGSKDGFVQGELLNDETSLAMPVCVPPEASESAGAHVDDA
jgi:hypothetical protein